MRKKLIILVFVFLGPAVVFIKPAVSADESLLGWWKLDDNQGTTVLDSSGRENHGTINNPNGGLGTDGSVWDIDPDRGTILSLNGDNVDGAYVSAGTIPAMSLVNSFTWAFWAKQDAAQGNNDDVILGNRWNGSTWIKFTPSLFEFGGNSPDTSLNYDNIPPDIWIHHAVVKDRTHYIYYRDGENSAENNIYNTSGDAIPFLMGGDVDGERWRGRLSHVRIYNRALSEDEIHVIMRGEPYLSSEPDPENGATDLPRDNLILKWRPGIFAETHDVYLGTVLDEVKNTERADTLGVLKIRDLGVEAFELDRLEFDRKYYWRVDEVNVPPDLTIYKGDIWNFTTEPLAYPIPGDNITATASGFTEGQVPENTINDSGMDTNSLHSNATAAMWLSDTSEPGSAWIQFEFDRAFKLHEISVWNYNGQLFLPGYGFKDVKIEYSDDGTNWTQMENVPEFARSTGTNSYAANTTVEFGDMIIKAVRITALSNWGSGIYNKYGLSEVHFMQIPQRARKPDPDDGESDVPIDVTLGWRPGREAAEHNMYFGTDRQAVEDGTTPPETVGQAGYGPMSLDLGSTYYWRIDEVNNAEIPALWQDDTWTFTTTEYLIVEDFESYNDIPIEADGSNLIYNKWMDGWTLNNGSTIGYFEAFQPTMETDIVHGGRQSVPLFYDNKSAIYSEVTVNITELEIGSDWTKGSPETLVIWFYGDPNNAAEQMYVKVNDAKVNFDTDLTRSHWQELIVDLDPLGTNMNDVVTISLGFEKRGAAGGSGMIFLDDILLYRPKSEPN
jgi:hypothetical protein